MPVRVRSCGVVGIEAYPIEVEVDVAPGLFGYETVGLPDSAVRESQQRVKAAIRNAGFEFPRKKVVVNLSPADIRKEGTSFDLPIAVGVLTASRQCTVDLSQTLIIGELGLSGVIRPVHGVLPMVLSLREQGVRRAVVPWDNGPEACAVPGMEVIAAETLGEALLVLAGKRPARRGPPPPAASPRSSTVDLHFVRGQPLGRRAIEIAAAGGHHALLVGPPGTGKTLLSRCLHGVLPPLDLGEQLETSRVYSVAGLLERGGLVRHRPFRAPHHTVTSAALVGGGCGSPRPGEVSLAHQGVLFLDELPEFSRNTREVLRQPMESGEVLISRSRCAVRFPARFQLIATMNPCPCGYHGVAASKTPCMCSPAAIERYAQRVSGPLRDRFDLHVPCPPVPQQALLDPPTAESSEVVRERVEQARGRQTRRLASTPFRCNAQLEGGAMEALCRFDQDSRALLKRVLDAMPLSARGLHRAARVARTIADLAGAPDVREPHLHEALLFRGAQR